MNEKSNSTLTCRRLLPSLITYSATHGLIDAVSSVIIFAAAKRFELPVTEMFAWAVWYNVLAFGLQAPLGWILDRTKTYRAGAVTGCVCALCALILFSHSIPLAVIFSGVGNALFHVGAGSLVLLMEPKKARLPGIFVAPGALGLFLGAWAGKTIPLSPAPWIASILVAIVALVWMKPRHATAPVFVDEKQNKLSWIVTVALLLLFSIGIRAVVGFVFVWPWKSHFELSVVLICCVVLGKALGGILADRFGWMRVGVSALIASIPCLLLGAKNPALAFAGMFLFNITMPITLVALFRALPKRPGLAFGLTCLALLVGSLPTFTALRLTLGQPWIVAAAILAAALTLFVALKKLFLERMEII